MKRIETRLDQLEFHCVLFDRHIAHIRATRAAVVLDNFIERHRTHATYARLTRTNICF